MMSRDSVKIRGSADTSYLHQTIDKMIWELMEKEQIPGLTLAIVQAPYIPRVVGYGLSDEQQRRLASPNTLWPIGPISQAFAAVAVMQLYEAGKLDINDPLGRYIADLPPAWQNITVLQLLRHASGIADYRRHENWKPFREWTFTELISLAAEEDLHFNPGSDVELSATNFLLLTEIIEAASGQTYHDFVTEKQIDFLGLRHTGFTEDLAKFKQEDLTQSANVHQVFKQNKLFIDPTETAASYDEKGTAVQNICSSALKGFADIWASAQDVSYWDIALAGSVLIHEAENRSLIYAPWTLPDGRQVPAVAGWHFYHHRGLMDIKGSVPGYSAFLSRFTDASELVCVTLLCNKEGIDFTNLGRRIAAAFGDLLATNYNDNNLFLYEGQFPAAETVKRLEDELKRRNIPLFAKFDHAENARQAGLELRPTTVVVFGSPSVGTALMQADQSVSLELPLKIAVWEDEAGSTWLAFPWLSKLAGEYSLTDSSVINKMQYLLEDLVRRAGSIY
ncbi:serine hydrolase [Candidatus Methanomassiliicoccus intestinalis]|uniref:serine hydrolase n=1 Tax=Candidatus Methanomassiliicoccus intestinalis TaxID=1406512 RepID=UPI0037DCE0A6